MTPRTRSRAAMPAPLALGVPPRRDHPTTTPWRRGRLPRWAVLLWVVIGSVVVGSMVVVTLGRLSIIVVPLVLALFPAALLWPVTKWLVDRRAPTALASLLTILGFLAVLTGAGGLLVPQVVAEAPGIAEEVEGGIVQVQALIDEGLPFVDEGTDIGELLALGQEQALDFLQREGVAIASGLAEGVTGLLFGIVALFFYLKDGPQLARWARRQFPRGTRDTVGEIGVTAWRTIGGYFRGQLLIALVDAIAIGIGLQLLGVPLVLPLTMLIFVASLFPVVGAFLSGAIAVLVALATEGLTIALAVLAVVLIVQQLESNILAPIVLGRATALHPLAVIVALTAGGVLLGILGAFLAVPAAASVARGARIVRDRIERDPGTPTPRRGSAVA